MERPYRDSVHRPQRYSNSPRSSLSGPPISPSDSIIPGPPRMSTMSTPLPPPRRISTMSPPPMQNQPSSYFSQPQSHFPPQLQQLPHQQPPQPPQNPAALSHLKRQSSYAPQPPSPQQQQPYFQQQSQQQPLPPSVSATRMSSTNFNHFDYPIVIAIDFGTTYSGCSYAFAQNETDIHDVTKWPKQNNNVYPKTPTLLYYKKGAKKLTEWGNGARLTMLKPTAKDGTLLHQFKLYLEDDSDKLRLPPLAEGITVLDAIVDYLKAMHLHIMSELRKGFANNYGPHQFRYCLTVPAIWSDRAKSTMREAAVRAGIVNRDDHPERLMLISEPEAAALYCEKRCDQWNLRHGDKFMICDAGGGTVDLIVYEIEETPSGRTLKEVTSGHGGACGSVFLDNNMRRLLAHRFKNYMQHIPSCAFESMMDSFIEMVKPEFDGNEDQFITLPASTQLDPNQLTNEAMGLEEGVLRLSAAELKKEVFDPVILQVLDLIEQQISQVHGRLDAIFLVGGFGSSNYLYDRVRAQFARRVGKIAVPPRGELAVVRGAVYFGLNPRVVTSKISRRSYGVMTRMTFEDGKDPEESAVVTGDGIKRCSTRFDVYIRKGQRIGVDFRISKNFWITYPKNTEADLYAYDGDPPIPRQVTDPGVTKIADFPIEIPTLPGVKIGNRVDLRIDFIFSLTELRIEAVVNNQQFVFTSKFEATDVYGA